MRHVDEVLQSKYHYLLAAHPRVLHRMCNDCLPGRQSSLIAVKIKEKEKKRLRLSASI